MDKEDRFPTLMLTRAAATTLCTLLTACSSPAKQAEPPAPAIAQAQAVQRYDLRGKVISIDKSAKRLTVDHEAIPGFMGAMTMAYPVKDERLLDGVTPGDQVTAKVVSTGTEFWLENVAKVSTGPPPK
jgi:protein SCO1